MIDSTPSSTEPSSGDTVQPGAWRGVASDLRTILARAKPQRGMMVLFIGLYFLASSLQILGLMCFNTGFSVMELLNDAPEQINATLMRGLSLFSIPSAQAWLVFFSLFLLMSILAIGLDHLGWMLRLKLMAAYEAEQTAHGLRLVCEADPRRTSQTPLRDMVLAVRGDCKSMRVVLQMQLLILVAIVQVAFPLIYIFTLDPGMSLLGLLVLAFGGIPLWRLARRAGGMSLSRQDVALEAGSQVSTMLSTLDQRSSTADERNESIEGIQRTIKRQHDLWRKQYEIRSLGQKVPQICSILGIYVVLIWGGQRIQQGSLTWGELLTFVLAIRLVVQPLLSLSNLWGKTAEHYPRARRHLQFIQQWESNAVTTAELQSLTGPVQTLEITNFSLPTPSGTSTELTLLLRQGETLTVVDTGPVSENPLLACLAGSRFVETGEIQLNSVSVNALKSAELRRLLTDEARDSATESVTISVTDRPSGEIPRQQILIFRDGLSLGQGDFEWYRQSFPQGPPQSESALHREQINLGVLEALETELSLEETS